MTGPSRIRHSCSPWALLGCGCGLVSMIGILLVFFSFGIFAIRERTNPYWNMRDDYACQMHLRNLGRAIASYRADHHGALPAGLAELKAHYIASPDWLRCPLGDRGLAVKAYRYTTSPAKPTDPLITCPNHAQGPIILQHNGLLRLHDGGLKRNWRQSGSAARPPTANAFNRGAR